MNIRKNVVIQHHGSRAGCYVTTFQGPLSVWNAYKRGRYTEDPSNLAAAIAAHGVRWGAYGDPAALPIEVIKRHTPTSMRWTGYTHQWRRPEVQALRAYMMASVESQEAAREAAAAGWRHFRVSRGDDVLPGEIPCPASDEAGNRTSCQSCGLCNGMTPRTGVRTSGPHERFLSNGAILYEGPSVLDGAPIVAVLTGLKDKSKNPKTGPMLQVWIMRSDIAPHLAQQSGQDDSVCGDCPLRPLLQTVRS